MQYIFIYKEISVHARNLTHAKMNSRARSCARDCARRIKSPVHGSYVLVYIKTSEKLVISQYIIVIILNIYV